MLCNIIRTLCLTFRRSPLTNFFFSLSRRFPSPLPLPPIINFRIASRILTGVSSFLYFSAPRLTVKNIENLRYKRRPVIHKCTRCGKGYQLETSLRRHQRLECGVEPRQSCPICGKKFTHRFKLTHHLASCRRKREYYETI